MLSKDVHLTNCGSVEAQMFTLIGLFGGILNFCFGNCSLGLSQSRAKLN